MYVSGPMLQEQHSLSHGTQARREHLLGASSPWDLAPRSLSRGQVHGQCGGTRDECLSPAAAGGTVRCQSEAAV
jgi:hypothetical protein